MILWLNGGPGSSSFLGLFMENGPYRLRRNDKKQVEPYDNPFSWNTCAMYMIFDQPAGVGLSAITDKSLYAPNEQVQTYQLYHALLSFFALYPQYKDLDFYIFGESFAGHYIPTHTHTILDGNKNGYPDVNLKGVGVGDGWVDPLTLQATYGEYGYAHGLIDLDDKAHVDELYRTCRIAVENTMPVPSAESDKICERVEDYTVKAAGRHPHDAHGAPAAGARDLRLSPPALRQRAEGRGQIAEAAMRRAHVCRPPPPSTLKRNLHVYP